MKKVTINDLIKCKREGRKFATSTAYDASFAQLFESQEMPVLLVGDSLGMVLQGHNDTLPVTVEDIAYHTRSVRAGSPNCLLMADLPFMSYATPEQACESSATLMRAGANMVKIECGATTTWEHWDGRKSRNHPMFGGALVWFYQNLAGMQADPKHPGYRHIIFKPQTVDELEFVTYSNQTPYGKAEITWKREDGKLAIEVMIPVGSEATVHIPTQYANMIKERGVPVKSSKSVKFVSATKHEVVVKIGSGYYCFHH